MSISKNREGLYTRCARLEVLDNYFTNHPHRLTSLPKACWRPIPRGAAFNRSTGVGRQDSARLWNQQLARFLPRPPSRRADRPVARPFLPGNRFRQGFDPLGTLPKPRSQVAATRLADSNSMADPSPSERDSRNHRSLRAQCAVPNSATQPNCVRGFAPGSTTRQGYPLLLGHGIMLSVFSAIAVRGRTGRVRAVVSLWMSASKDEGFTARE